MNKVLVFSSYQTKHQQLCTPYVYRQGMPILKVLDLLKSHELGLENKQYHHSKNFATRKVFPQEASQQIVDYEKNGNKIYHKMIKKRLQPDSTAEIFALVKNLQLNCVERLLN